ncbi:hypothetical protein ACX31A_12410 [Dermacoccus nishinomiyaensis]
MTPEWHVALREFVVPCTHLAPASSRHVTSRALRAAPTDWAMLAIAVKVRIKGVEKAARDLSSTRSLGRRLVELLKCSQTIWKGLDHMAFEVFDKRHAPMRSAPSVTIQKRGIMSINGAAHALLNRAMVVELLYDKERKVMALRAAEPSPRSYELRDPTPSGRTLLSATAFTQAFDIDTTVSRRYEPFVEDGMLCINVAGPSTVVQSNRTKNRSSTPNEGAEE